MERSTLSRQRRHKMITMTPVFDTHWSILCPRRCPEKKIASKFTMVESKGYAEAEIPMYRFADFNVVNIQCDIFICRGSYRFEFPWFYSLEEFPFSVEKKSINTGHSNRSKMWPIRAISLDEVRSFSHCWECVAFWLEMDCFDDNYHFFSTLIWVKETVQFSLLGPGPGPGRLFAYKLIRCELNRIETQIPS